MSFRYIKAKPIVQSTSVFSLSEIYNINTEMPEFAILSATGVQIGPWIKCKDFIHDCIWGAKSEKSYTMFGFKYVHGTDPLPNLKRLHLALRYRGTSTNTLNQILINPKKTIENLEKKLGFKSHERTKFSRIIENYFLIYGSKKWMTASHTVSFFTFLIRASLNNTGGRIGTIGKTSPVKKDCYYYRGGSEYYKLLKSKGIEGFEPNWTSAKSVGDIHGCGFLSHTSAAYQDSGKLSEKDDWDF